jgi:hypothetical protein
MAPILPRVSSSFSVVKPIYGEQMQAEQTHEPEQGEPLYTGE